MTNCMNIYHVHVNALASFTTYTHTQRGRTAVYCASYHGHSEVVKLLVQAGVDLELQYKVLFCGVVWQRNALLHYTITLYDQKIVS